MMLLNKSESSMRGLLLVSLLLFNIQLYPQATKKSEDREQTHFGVEDDFQHPLAFGSAWSGLAV